jgi:cobaltochelatase CobN
MALQKIDEQLWRTAGDTRERLELYAAWLIEQALDGPLEQLEEPGWHEVKAVIESLRIVVAPRLDACGPAEMRGLLDA